MSGIYICGMEMPKLARIIEIHPDGFVCTRAGVKLGVAIPDPDHGRLIDADAFVRQLLNEAERARPLFTSELWRYISQDIVSAVISELND